MSVEALAPVVVGLDLSPSGVAAVDFAAHEASAREAPLVIRHVYTGTRAGAAQRLLATAAQRAGARHPGLTVRTELAAGAPAASLVAGADSAALLVVGHRGHRSRRGDPTTVGSVALRVITLADVPVIVHRPVTGPALPGVRPVLVGVDGTGRSDPVVEFAFAQAALHGVPLLAEHVWSQTADAVPARLGADGRDEDAERTAATRMLADVLEPWSRKYPDVAVRQAVRHSLDAAVSLTAASRSAGLVVVGLGRAEGTGRLAGSVARALVHRAGCPVAVVPTS